MNKTAFFSAIIFTILTLSCQQAELDLINNLKQHQRFTTQEEEKEFALLIDKVQLEGNDKITRELIYQLLIHEDSRTIPALFNKKFNTDILFLINGKEMDIADIAVQTENSVLAALYVKAKKIDKPASLFYEKGYPLDKEFIKDSLLNSLILEENPDILREIAKQTGPLSIPKKLIRQLHKLETLEIIIESGFDVFEKYHFNVSDSESISVLKKYYKNIYGDRLNDCIKIQKYFSNEFFGTKPLDYLIAFFGSLEGVYDFYDMVEKESLLYAMNKFSLMPKKNEYVLDIILNKDKKSINYLADNPQILSKYILLDNTLQISKDLFLTLNYTSEDYAFIEGDTIDLSKIYVFTTRDYMQKQNLFDYFKEKYGLSFTRNVNISVFEDAINEPKAKYDAWFTVFADYRSDSRMYTDFFSTRSPEDLNDYLKHIMKYWCDSTFGFQHKRHNWIDRDNYGNWPEDSKSDPAIEDIIMLLIELGADPQTSINPGYKYYYPIWPLRIAMIKQNEAAIEKIIKMGAKPGYYDIVYAYKTDDIERVSYFLEKGADINEQVILYSGGIEEEIETHTSSIFDAIVTADNLADFQRTIALGADPHAVQIERVETPDSITATQWTTADWAKRWRKHEIYDYLVSLGVGSLQNTQ